MYLNIKKSNKVRKRSFKELIERSRASRLSRAQRDGYKPLEEEGFEDGRMIRKKEFLDSKGKTVLFERGDQYSFKRELKSLKNRQKKYDAAAKLNASKQQQHEMIETSNKIKTKNELKVKNKNQKPGFQIFKILSTWDQMEKEYTRYQRKHNKKEKRLLHHGWNEWLQVRNPILHDQIAELNKRRMDLHEWFNLLDADGSGEVSTSELVDPMLTVGICKSRKEVEKLVASVDQDGSGEIGFDEFLSIICSEPAESKAKNGTKRGNKHGTIPSTNKTAGNTKNALVKLYQVASQGELGDECLQFSSLLTSYRRKVLMRALAPNEDEVKSEKRKHDQSCVDALQRLQIETKYGIE